MDNKLKTLKEIRYTVKNTNHKVLIVMYSVMISITISLISLFIR